MNTEHDQIASAQSGQELSSSVLAGKLRWLRRQANMTLQQLSQRCAISVSALSKIENGQLSPTYEKIAALALGLGVDVGELFSPTTKASALGRRSVTRRGQGVTHETDQYRYEILHADLAEKRFVPLVTTIKAHDRADFPRLLSHDGEELLYVLSGQVVLHTDLYAPLELGPGDSCYIDSTMGHACISGSGADATILWISSHADLR
ncbi:XRE family transcriptional regulator [Pseudomonas sp. ER28]|uniref:helix-turn-helix domain-containing protein n=1 Tax=Pseudomonas TaxID=286 RepID=UPI0009BBE1B5|nr:MULTISPECIES: XRE family transcriptional regulator [Pseudomonas]MDF3174601.1 XRE family transcriptional regulator [Pseudomonas sp. ER28]USX36096.1 XRE family transcriptional regulator [Pseudomonas putida]